MLSLPPHNLKIAVLQPQIAPNTGNIARLCVATGTELHLVRPMGFVLSDRALKRSAMDYWPRLKLTLYDDDAAFFARSSLHQSWFFTSKANRSLWEASFRGDEWLIFGSETSGLSDELIRGAGNRAIRIPQTPGERCLNLATATGIVLFEALRQTIHTTEKPPGEGG